MKLLKFGLSGQNSVSFLRDSKTFLAKHFIQTHPNISSARNHFIMAELFPNRIADHPSNKNALAFYWVHCVYCAPCLLNVCRCLRMLKLPKHRDAPIGKGTLQFRQISPRLTHQPNCISNRRFALRDLPRISEASDRLNIQEIFSEEPDGYPHDFADSA